MVVKKLGVRDFVMIDDLPVDASVLGRSRGATVFA